VAGFIDSDPPIAIEFLFNRLHGHPGLLATEGLVDAHGREYAVLFRNTESMLAKLVNRGYQVYYIWESEYHAKAQAGGGLALGMAAHCRRFDGTLEW
jgi:hypothetical protein